MTLLDPAPHRHHPVRPRLLRIAEAALAAIDPYQAVVEGLGRSGDTLRVARREVALTDVSRAVVLGLGKASVAMGRAAADVLADRSPSGMVVSNAPGDAGPLRVEVGAHPVPDASSERAGRLLLATAAEAGPGDLAVVLISGGGSALATVPAPGLSLADLALTNTLLLRSGATIDELNAVRKHLSALKGGRLALALGAAEAVVTMVLSDVVGSPLDVIASGPTVPDPTTLAEAWQVITSRGLADAVPQTVAERLSGADGHPSAETPTAGDVFGRQIIAVVADAGVAADAAAAAGRADGWNSTVVTTELQGEARRVADAITTRARRIEPGDLLVYAGETTVTVVGDGRGGRNQELALAASLAIEDRPDLTLLCLGTDGIDGMSPAAGAFADAGAVRRGREAGLDAADHLRRNDSHPYLAAVGNTVECGPTGTNVGDLILVARAP